MLGKFALDAPLIYNLDYVIQAIIQQLVTKVLTKQSEIPAWRLQEKYPIKPLRTAIVNHRAARLVNGRDAIIV